MTTESEWPHGFGRCHCGCGKTTTIIDNTNRKRGYVAGQPRKFIHGHHAYKRHIYTDQERFDKFVIPEPNSGCYLFMGTPVGDGYGAFRLNGSGMLAHHAAWLLAGRALPPGAKILHRCDTPCCVNVDHLFVGDCASNSADMARKSRGRHGVYPYGVRPNGRGFSARHTVPGTSKARHLGTFDTVEEAAAVAAAAKKEAYGP